MKKNYEPMPIVDCDRFYLRTITKKDVWDLFEYGSDPEVTRFLSWGPFEDVSEARWTIDKHFLTRPDRNLPIGYAIIYRENNKMIGTIDFHTIDQYSLYGEIGYCLNKSYQGMGIMTEALKKMIGVGFNVLGLNRIEIRHVVSNKASEKVINNCDFRFEGILRQRYYDMKINRYQDVKTYSILKDEYIKEELSWQ